jgi:hypothetical protein
VLHGNGDVTEMRAQHWENVGSWTFVLVVTE